MASLELGRSQIIAAGHSVEAPAGVVLGRMEGVGFELRTEASLVTLTSDVLKSSAIEGEVLDALQVRSSIARHLGMEVAGIIPASRAVEGVVEMMLDATQQFSPAPAQRALVRLARRFISHRQKWDEKNHDRRVAQAGE